MAKQQQKFFILDCFHSRRNLNLGL